MAVDVHANYSDMYVDPPRRREPLVPSPVLGMLIFVATEVMFFTALLSAFLIIKAGSPNWAPPGDVTLPVTATALNTGVLFASGVLLYLAGRALTRAKDWERATTLTGWATILGACFVCFQGMEWVKLIHYGMTMSSGVFGACFYLLIGSHAVHALAGVVGLLQQCLRLRTEHLVIASFQAMQIFWFFVVGVWPILYVLVYLS